MWKPANSRAFRPHPQEPAVRAVTVVVAEAVDLEAEPISRSHATDALSTSVPEPGSTRPTFRLTEARRPPQQRGIVAHEAAVARLPNRTAATPPLPAEMAQPRGKSPTASILRWIIKRFAPKSLMKA